jgi:hypothetical protein
MAEREQQEGFVEERSGVGTLASQGGSGQMNLRVLFTSTCRRSLTCPGMKMASLVLRIRGRGPRVLLMRQG